MRYAITDLRSLAGGESARIEMLLKLAAGWAADGVEFVQLREKQRAAGALCELARQLKRALGERTKLLVNGRADVAVAAGADGVHLSSHADELTPGQVREVFAKAGMNAPVVSVSCHSVAEVERARQSAADVMLFGPVFEKRVGGEVVLSGVGLGALREARAAAGRVRVLALGGVTWEKAAACVAAGADGVAGIRLFQSRRG